MVGLLEVSKILLGDFDADGTKVGASDGDCVGATARPGASVGLTVGATDINNGADVGIVLGCFVGFDLGCFVGFDSVGE